MIQRLSLHAYGKLMVAATFFLIIAGGSVTSTRSGLAVPDWPLSFGGLFPRMVGGVFFEHGHRMVAGTVALLTVGLVVWVWRSPQAVSLRGLAVAALVAVLLQAALGGMTVLLKLPVAVSAGHACLAQIFFCLIISFTLVTSQAWKERQGGAPAADRLTSRLALATTALIFIQIILGAVMRHAYAGLAIPDFPLSYGRLVPAFHDGMVALNFSHRATALAVTLMILVTAVRALRVGAGGWIANPAKLLLAAVALQVVLGACTVWTQLNPWVATAHVAGGALVLSTSLVLTLRSLQNQAKVQP